MEVKTFKLYQSLLLNSMDNKLINELLMPDEWDCIELDQTWLVPNWEIEGNLTSKEFCPYLWSGYKGIPMRLSFYPLCFFSFFSGVMYAVVKNGNIVNHWNYWDMHKWLSSDFLFQSMLLYSGFDKRDNTALSLGGATDMDIEGVKLYGMVHTVIRGFFKEFGLEDFDIFDEYGFREPIPISNLGDVLATFHRFGAACFFLSLIDEDSAIYKKRIWGGKGMSQIFNFAR